MGTTERPEWDGRFFRWPLRASHVSVARNGSLQTALDVPEDVYLSVYWTGSHDVEVERATFRGRVEIRTLLADDRNLDTTGGMAASTVMEQAPFVLAIENAEVVVETPSP